MSLTRKFLDELSSADLIERLDLALEGADLGIWDWDLRDNSVQFDRRWCTMLGLVHAETPMVLETWSSRVHPDDIAGCYADIGAHVEGRTDHYQNVHRMRHADGTWRFIMDRGRISGRDANGAPIRFTGTHLDVTALKVAETRVRREQQARIAVLTHWAAMLAHELNTPLQVILLASNVLSDSRRSGPSADADQDAVATIADMVERVGRVTSALRLLASETDTGIAAESAAPGPDAADDGDVGRALAIAHTLFESRLAGLGITCTIDDRAGADHAQARLADLLRALVLLLDLAIDRARTRTADERVIRFHVRSTPSHVEVVCRYGSDESPPSASGIGGLSPTELLTVLADRFGGSVTWTPAPPVHECVVRIPRVASASA